MAVHLHSDDSITAIADAIRLKTDSVAEMRVEDMPLAISMIEGGGNKVRRRIGQASITTADEPITFFDVPLTEPVVPGEHIWISLCALKSEITSGNAQFNVAFNNSQNKSSAYVFTTGNVQSTHYGNILMSLDVYELDSIVTLEGTFVPVASTFAASFTGSQFLKNSPQYIFMHTPEWQGLNRKRQIDSVTLSVVGTHSVTNAVVEVFKM